MYKENYNSIQQLHFKNIIIMHYVLNWSQAYIDELGMIFEPL